MAPRAQDVSAAAETSASSALSASGQGVGGDFNGGDLADARLWWHQSLQAAQRAAGFIEQSQRLHAEFVRAWFGALAQADHEFMRAEDPAALMAMPAQLAQRQLELAMDSIKTQTERLLMTELEWSEQSRLQAAAMGQAWLAHLNHWAEVSQPRADGFNAGPGPG